MKTHFKYFWTHIILNKTSTKFRAVKRAAQARRPLYSFRPGPARPAKIFPALPDPVCYILFLPVAHENFYCIARPGPLYFFLPASPQNFFPVPHIEHTWDFAWGFHTDMFCLLDFLLPIIPDLSALSDLLQNLAFPPVPAAKIFFCPSWPGQLCFFSVRPVFLRVGRLTARAPCPFKTPATDNLAALIGAKTFFTNPQHMSSVWK